MRITGTWADGRVLHLRELTLGDYVFWAECKRDWPKDKRGFYTLARAIADVDRNVRDNASVVVPLAPDTRWIQTLIAYTDDALIGLARHRAIGTSCHVLQQAIHPDQRGGGWFSAMNELLSRYAFEVLGADVVTHELLPDDTAAGARAYVGNRQQYGSLGQTKGETGKTLQAGRMRRSDFEAWAAAARNAAKVPTLEFKA